MTIGGVGLVLGLVLSSRRTRVVTRETYPGAGETITRDERRDPGVY